MHIRFRGMSLDKHGSVSTQQAALRVHTAESALRGKSVTRFSGVRTWNNVEDRTAFIKTHNEQNQNIYTLQPQGWVRADAFTRLTSL